MRSLVHAERECAGQYCVIHNPSEHHMSGWPIEIRRDKNCLTERICPHGVGHPDPDSLVWINGEFGENAWGVHGCDGCCWEATDG